MLSILMEKKFKYKLVKNPFYFPIFKKDNKKITNTSLVIIWRNKKTGENKYLLQKRSKFMKNGKNKLGFPGGMIEKEDESLQFGALRELLEESQVLFKDANNISIKTIRQLLPYTFPLMKKQTNFTFYLIICSFTEPKVMGPIDFERKPFLKSSREVDLEDNKWNDKKLENRIKFGHAFLSKSEIFSHYKKEPQIWKYSKITVNNLLPIFEK
jgi:8-oxo-dGTP pyrophosphatase MutT (NUDIX family)